MLKQRNLTVNPEEWLNNEDIVCKEQRIKRLEWLDNQHSASNLNRHLLLHGGEKSIFLYEEAKYCFTYGQYIASCFLSSAFIENTIASYLYMTGINKATKLSFTDLINEAYSKNIITEKEKKTLNKVRLIRNPLAHFKKYNSKEDVSKKAFDQDLFTYELLESDAKKCLSIMFKLLSKLSY